MEAAALPASTCEIESSPCAAFAVQIGGTACLRLSPFDADLQRVVAAWAAMPKEARQAILAIVDACRVT
jgi:hypothetical protein